jgi:hypothetical protein
MHASGQTDIAIPIWNINFNGADPDGVVDWVYGERIDYGLGALHAQAKSDLIALLNAVKQSGFKRVIIRFNFYWPIYATSWSETEYQKQLGFLRDVRTTVYQTLSGSSVAILFDLGGELGGGNSYQKKPFVQRMWADYVASYGTADTVGFSIAWVPGRFTDLLQTLLQVNGKTPEKWAFDIYPSGLYQTHTMDYYMQEISTEMGAYRAQPIIILETWHNDPQTYTQVNTALNGASAISSLNLDGLFQWSLMRQRSVDNLDSAFSQQALADQYSNFQLSSYAPLLPSRRAEVTSSNANVFYITDSDCAVTTTYHCAIKQYWSAPPPGKILVITTGAGSLMACVASAGSQNVSWITQGIQFSFKAYYRNPNECSVPPATTTPNSVSSVLVEIFYPSTS